MAKTALSEGRRVGPSVAGGAQTIYVAIDPGFRGGIGVVFPDGGCFVKATPVRVLRTKKPRAKTKSGRASYSVKSRYEATRMYEFLRKLKSLAKAQQFNLVLGIEFQHARPGDGKPQLMSLGVGYGRWLQTIELLFGENYQLIVPGVWKPRYLPKGAAKPASVALAMQLYPGLSLKKDEDGKAEALLMADYLRRRANAEPFLRTPERDSSASKKRTRRKKKKAYLFK